MIKKKGFEFRVKLMWGEGKYRGVESVVVPVGWNAEAAKVVWVENSKVPYKSMVREAWANWRTLQSDDVREVRCTVRLNTEQAVEVRRFQAEEFCISDR